MKIPFRVAIAGCHRMVQPQSAGHNFASAFAAVPETEMVAVYDRGAETRSEFVRCWGALPAYDDFARMLQEVQPDILCIATRQTMHAEQIETAVAAGVRAILCDKPLATSLLETDRIVSACRAHAVTLAFALDRRWQPAYLHLRQLVAEGIVGRVTSALAFGCPNLINHGCHWYDTALMLMGDPEPLWVSGWVDDLAEESADSRRRLDPPGRGQIGLSNGAVLSVVADGGRRPAFEIIGEEGRLLIFHDAELCYLWTESGKEGPPGLRPLDMPLSRSPWPAGPAMVRDLVNALESHSPTACNIEQARRATEIGFAIHLSHIHGSTRVVLPVTDRSLSVPSFAWGNE